MRTMIHVRSQAHDAKNDGSTPVPLCARSDARYFRAFRSGKPGPVHSDRERPQLHPRKWLRPSGYAA